MQNLVLGVHVNLWNSLEKMWVHVSVNELCFSTDRVSFFFSGNKCPVFSVCHFKSIIFHFKCKPCAYPVQDTDVEWKWKNSFNFIWKDNRMKISYVVWKCPDSDIKLVVPKYGCDSYDWFCGKEADLACFLEGQETNFHETSATSSFLQQNWGQEAYPDVWIHSNFKGVLRGCCGTICTTQR